MVTMSFMILSIENLKRFKSRGKSPNVYTQILLLHRTGVRNVARQMHYLDAHLEQACAFGLTETGSVYENGKALRAFRAF
ncbi:hypothetical protein KDA_05230 [Dictyobacter alpinus]|uniref:Uncharacterized protein n=1 Tax=Dictyobacter alpinus TaxID=2014873 RepID=A0A402B119_9CHLR|nr:hypothetical protein KDA_05230 [Dictyobacter alpinus]